MTIGGGNITNNFAALKGAGIYVNTDTDGVYISGNAGIYDNIGTGDIYLTGDEILKALEGKAKGESAAKTIAKAVAR